MTRYTLEPKEILPYCPLMEAVYWVAFERYPIQTFDITNKETCDYLTFFDDKGEGITEDINSYFTVDICDKFGLPHNPIYIYDQFGGLPLPGDPEAYYVSEGKETPFFNADEYFKTIGIDYAEQMGWNRENVQREIEERIKYREADGNF